jgi:hypothetical protein
MYWNAFENLYERERLCCGVLQIREVFTSVVLLSVVLLDRATENVKIVPLSASRNRAQATECSDEPK